MSEFYSVSAWPLILPYNFNSNFHDFFGESEETSSSVDTFELWISISDMLLRISHPFFSHKGKIWSPVFTSFQKTIATGFNIGA